MRQTAPKVSEKGWEKASCFNGIEACLSEESRRHTGEGIRCFRFCRKGQPDVGSLASLHVDVPVLQACARPPRMGGKGMMSMMKGGPYDRPYDAGASKYKTVLQLSLMLEKGMSWLKTCSDTEVQVLRKRRGMQEWGPISC